MIGTVSVHRSMARAGRSVVLGGGLTFAVLVRWALNGESTQSAFVAGAAFGVGLVALGLRAGWRSGRPSLDAVGLGVGGGFALILLPAIARSRPGLPVGIHPEPFVAWAAVTIMVAVGEEAILRGVLFDAVLNAVGPPAAIAVTCLAFALIHVPLYGWHVVPLDLAVGIWLAGLRLVSGGVAAPAIGHVIADLATWWL
jgi:membrane protease YdiL (CAAX protease family)